MRAMKRAKQQISREECEEILRRGSFGVLALSGDEGCTYAVPSNYVFLDGMVYFHGAPAGHKMDSVRRTPKASFCVVAKNTPVPEMLAADFLSATAFGKLSVVEDPEEKRRALFALQGKYAPGEREAAAKEIEESIGYVAVIRLEPEAITGKMALEAVRIQAAETAARRAEAA